MSSAKKIARQNPRIQVSPKYVFRSSVWILIGGILRLEFILLILFAVTEMFLLTENVPGELYIEEIIFFIILQIINVVFLSWAILSWFAKKYVIVSDKIIIKEGVFNPKQNIHLFKNIESIYVKKSFMGVIFGYGSLIIYLPILQQTARLDRIGNPKKYINIIEQCMAHFKDDEKTGNVVIQS